MAVRHTSLNFLKVYVFPLFIISGCISFSSLSFFYILKETASYFLIWYICGLWNDENSILSFSFPLSVMEEDCDFHRWDELIPEALVLIFRKLSLTDKLSIPHVCKSWRRVMNESDCWQEIDFGGLSYYFPAEAFNRLLQKLLRKSSGLLHTLCAEGLPNDRSFSLIADQ